MVPPYEIVPHTCAGCEAMDEMRAKLEEDKTPKAGLSLRVHRADPLDYMDD